MHRISALLAVFVGLASVSAQAAAPGIDKLAWLAGCWQGQFGEAGTVEQWLPPAGGTMLGMSRTVKQGKTVDFEFMQLREQDGTLAFIPQPSGRPPAVFRLLRMGEADAVFEDPERDFPRRIAYARQDATHLLASLEGSKNGELRRVEFAFVRVGCEAGN
jgi:hypothetical protein